MIYRKKTWAQKRTITQVSQEAYEAHYGEDSLGVYPTVKEAEKAIQGVLEAHMESKKQSMRNWT